ncbi:MAG TPA: sulfotransferase [Rhodanobacteraceae bacterium]|nr:sulfotransferase [Rhodanobacteraceae bacterium]
MAGPRSEEDLLATVRAEVLRGNLQRARSIADQAIEAFPESLELRRAQAGILQQCGLTDAAEAALRTLLAKHPDDAASAFSLARMLREQGRTATAAGVLRACFAADVNRRDANLSIAAIELLDESDRKRDAEAIAKAAIEVNPGDPRLHAYAGMLAVQTGEFERARAHYLFALDHDPRAVEWHVPIGLASTLRYPDPAHPDFARFRDGLRRDDLSDLARAELHFALAKACDDIGDYGDAAENLRPGNAIRKRNAAWSRKAWRRAIEARLAAASNVPGAAPTPDFSPIFIVGMPRSGTTLLAERLGRLPGVCNRGEQPWLARLALQPALQGTPDGAALERATRTYVAQVRQDNAGPARWFVDKQPLNFRYVDLALALFPDAHVVYCRRNARDNALSLWMQCFLEDVQGYSYDFDDIARVMRDCGRLMEHWRKRYPGSIHAIRYEDLVAAPEEAVAELIGWIGIPNAAAGNVATDRRSDNVISTASLWQARQPIHTRSVNRSEHYLPYIPELSRLSVE